ncbi:hypothetical protein AKO1_004434, partial [Acrasis kona]
MFILFLMIISVVTVALKHFFISGRLPLQEEDTSHIVLIDALHLDGSQYVDVPPGDFNLCTEDFTLELKLRVDEFPPIGSEEVCFISLGDYTGRFKMSFVDNNRLRITYKLSSGEAVDTDIPSINVSDKDWFDLALTYSSQNSETFIYINNRLHYQFRLGGERFLSKTDKSLMIGKCHSSGKPLKGSIHSFHLHSRALPFSKLNYNAPLPWTIVKLNFASNDSKKYLHGVRHIQQAPIPILHNNRLSSPQPPHSI